MSEAALDVPLAKSATGRTSALFSFWALFSATVARQAISRRLIVMAALYLLPLAFTILMRYNGMGFHGPRAGYEPLFAEFLVIFFFLPPALLPLTALVYASGMIQDEIEEQTITYLLIRPLPRWSVFLAKLLATMVVTIALTASFTAITYAAIGWGQPDYWGAGAMGRMLRTIALFSLSLAAYDTLFGLFSLVIKRAFLVGIAYIILLEGLLAAFEFILRKLTVMYYFRVLCERWMHLGDVWTIQAPVKWTFNVDLAKAPELSTCLLTLGGSMLALMILAGLIMQTREFRVKTPEGN